MSKITNDIHISRSMEGISVSIQFAPEKIVLGDIKDMIAEVLLVATASYEATLPRDVSEPKKEAPETKDSVPAEEAKPAPKKTRTRKATKTKQEAVEEEPEAQVADEPEEKPEEAKPEPKKTRTRKATKTKQEAVEEEPEAPAEEEPEEESEDDFDDTPVTRQELRTLAKEMAASGIKGKNAVKKVLGKYTKVGKLVAVKDEDVTDMYNDLCDVYDELFPEEEDAE